MKTRDAIRAFCWLLSAQAALALLEPAAAGAADAAKLASSVQIRRTQYGVPHIQGESFEAAAFGFGYCQAEDHLLDVMRGILGTRGELAQTFGPGDDQKNVEADFFNRQFRVYRRAVATYHQLDPDYRSMVEGFAAGLNFYVERHRASVPDWAPTVTGHDVAAYGVAGVMRFAFNRSNLIKDFLKTQGVATAMFDDAPDDSMVGSNMWAFAPSRSRSGRTILMGNPHQPWAPVSTYYEAHMIVPGKLNFYGSTFIGRPILTSGWNEHLGWSHTVNAPDLEEIYELALDRERPDHYRFDGASVPLERDDVVVGIKGKGEPASETRTFWHTPLGPVIHRTADKVFVLRSASCYENYRAYEQWLRMTQTKSFAEFRDGRDEPGADVQHLLRRSRRQYLLSLERHGAELAASGPQGAGRARGPVERYLDEVPRDQRASANDEPAGGLRAKLQLAPLSDESVCAARSGAATRRTFRPTT